MAQCIYPYCSTLSGSPGSVCYYRFPDDENLRQKWMSMIPQVLSLSKEKITPRSYLCANHFESDCFNFGEDGKVKSMKPSAIPAIFYVPPNKPVVVAAPVKDDEDPDILMEAEEPPTALKGSSYAVLLKKLRAEEANLIAWKEKVKKEEEEFAKVEEQLKCVESGDKSWEVEDTYQKLLKKMRPIAPKIPLKRKPKTLEEVIVGLRKEHKISEEAGIVLLHLFADVQVDVHPLPPLAKEGVYCFAQVLSFYASTVLENLRSMFDVSIPKISLVRSWYNAQPGEPGWNRQAFNDLKREAKRCGPDKKLLCSLLLAETSLKRQEEWDGKKMRGFVDCGPLITNSGFDLDVDGLPRARSALALMVAPLDQQYGWKLPVAYFFVNYLTSGEKANIIRECILRLHSVGAVILSLTLNLHTWEKGLLDTLGVCIDLLPNLCPYFVHPSDPLLRVHVIFDHCTTLTSVQNLWYSTQIFKDSQKNLVDWKYVSELIKIQEAQASIAQTFDGPLWCWEPDFIKNRLLAQLFSCCTADAMEYCWVELKLAQFEGCEGTVNFIRTMAQASQLINSRRFMKKESDKGNALLRSSHLQLLDYLSKLQKSDGKFLYAENDGAIHYLYVTLMSCQELLRQVPGFSSNSVSLDHLELLFYTIRSYIGWDVTPTARQFTAAFTTHILKYGYFNSWASAQTDAHWWIDAVDLAYARKEGRLACKPEIPIPYIPVGDSVPIVYEHVYPNVEFGKVSAYQYVAICVVKTLAGILHCDACLLALQEPFTTDNPLLLLLRKTCSAVICPSRDVLQVCAAAEHHLQLRLKTADGKLKSKIFQWRDENFITKVGVSVMTDLLHRKTRVFSCLNDHLQDCAPDASHLYRLVRGITRCYVRMRIRKFKSWCPV